MVLRCFAASRTRHATHPSSLPPCVADVDVDLSAGSSSVLLPRPAPAPLPASAAAPPAAPLGSEPGPAFSAAPSGFASTFGSFTSALFGSLPPAPPAATPAAQPGPAGPAPAQDAFQPVSLEPVTGPTPTFYNPGSIPGLGHGPPLPPQHTPPPPFVNQVGGGRPFIPQPSDLYLTTASPLLQGVQAPPVESPAAVEPLFLTPTGPPPASPFATPTHSTSAPSSGPPSRPPSRPPLPSFGASPAFGAPPVFGAPPAFGTPTSPPPTFATPTGPPPGPLPVGPTFGSPTGAAPSAFGTPTGPPPASGGSSFGTPTGPPPGPGFGPPPSTSEYIELSAIVTLFFTPLMRTRTGFRRSCRQRLPTRCPPPGLRPCPRPGDVGPDPYVFFSPPGRR